MHKLVTTIATILIAFSFQANAADTKEVKTDSGIVIETIKEGAGENPKKSDTVSVHYRGVLTDGKEFANRLDGLLATYARRQAV